MKDAKDLIPWKVTVLPTRPYEGFWSFNPSIWFDGDRWLCVLRCCDYAMPDGVTVRSKTARVGQQTKNAMVVLDPTTWTPTQIFKMHEKDEMPRAPCSHAGYEDMRLFWTARGGLQGIAASLHLQRAHKPVDGRAAHQPPEQVVVTLDDQFDIVAAQPIRGPGWSGSPQKNWVPFDRSAEPRFLYAIDKGVMYGVDGPVHGLDAHVTYVPRELPPSSPVVPVARASAPADAAAPAPASEVKHAAVIATPTPAVLPPSTDLRSTSSTRRPPPVRGSDVRILRTGRMHVDVQASRPAQRTRVIDSGTRMLGGRSLVPKYEGLRGGSQLVHVSDDAWLALGHEMKFVNGKKHYWHTWYLVDSKGKVRAVSEPMKLVSNGIEFAAGLALDGDRLVVSFGVDDMECRIGETRLSAVMKCLHMVGR